MRTRYRHLRQWLVGLASAVVFGSSPLHADPKPLTVLVGYSPGGTVDTVARVVAEALHEQGYQAIVENRPGAAGRIAMAALARAKPDGRTIIMSPAETITLAPHVVSEVNYDPLQDVTAVGSAVRMGFALAVGDSNPVDNLKDFLELAREDSMLGAYGTPGTGTAMHFIGSILSEQSGVPLTHIPYKGGSAAVTDAIGGTLPAVITTMPNLLPMHRQGRLRIIAVSEAERNQALPDVPTFKSLGYDGLVLDEILTFFAPSGTPDDVVADLNQAITAAVNSPRATSLLQQMEYEVYADTPESLNAQIRDTHDTWQAVVERSGHRAD